MEAHRILYDYLEGRWIGRLGSIEWMAGSQDLTPSDYIGNGCSYLRDKVYLAPGQFYQTLNPLGHAI